MVLKYGKKDEILLIKWQVYVVVNVQWADYSIHRFSMYGSRNSKYQLTNNNNNPIGPYMSRRHFRECPVTKPAPAPFPNTTGAG